MGFKEKLNNIFRTKDGEIQRAYEAYDRASDLLTARDKNPNAFEKTQELEEALKEAEKRATELLKNYEGVKSWPGIFREMHMNLARLYLKTEKYDEALKECEKIDQYNPIDSAELREAIKEAMTGKKLDASQLDEVGVA